MLKSFHGLVFISIWLFPLSSHTQTLYRVQSIGLLPGDSYSWGGAINDRGQVTGFSRGSSVGTERAIFWDPVSGIQNIGVLPGARFSMGRGINALGSVVGSSTFPGSELRAFYWDSSKGLVDMGVLPGSNSSWSPGINNSNVAIGTSGSRTFKWTISNGIQPFGEPPTDRSSTSYAINDAGYVVGYSSGFHSLGSAVLWDPNGNPLSLGILPGHNFSWATAFNDSLAVVGGSDNGVPMQGQAFLWTQSGGMEALGTLPGRTESTAFGINNTGLVVGRSRVLTSADRAFIWERSYGIQDLNNLIDPGTPGWYLISAWGVNNNGQIVGHGWLNGQQRGFVATPVAEPATCLGLGAGLVSLLWRRRKRKTCNCK